MTEEDKAAYQTKLDELKEIMKGEDVEEIEIALGKWFDTTKPLTSIKNAEQVRKEDTTTTAAGENAGKTAPEAQTVDAAFKEVDDTEKK